MPTFDQHIPLVGQLPRSIQDLDVCEQYSRLRMRARNLILLGLEACVEFDLVDPCKITRWSII